MSSRTIRACSDLPMLDTVMVEVRNPKHPLCSDERTSRDVATKSALCQEQSPKG